VNRTSDKGSLYFTLGMTKGAFWGIMILIVAVIVGFWKIHDQQNEAERQRRNIARLVLQGVEAHKFACATKADTKEQIARSQAYLDGVRSGQRPAIPGISDSDIVQQIRSRQAFLDALSAVNCPPPGKEK
jgi:hypothetical protein